MSPLGPIMAAARSVWSRTWRASRDRLITSASVTNPMATSGTARAIASLMRMGRRTLWAGAATFVVAAELSLMAMARARAFPAKSPPRAKALSVRKSVRLLEGMQEQTSVICTDARVTGVLVPPCRYLTSAAPSH
jgi:hypothetical protein